MAGGWIKVEKNTPQKPEVLRIAAALDIDPDSAFAKCFRFWAWCDDHLTDGNASGVTPALVDSIVGFAGFASAMADVGWLDDESCSLRIPNFDRHLSQSAKARGLTAQRVAKSREEKCNGTNVTGALPEERRGRGEEEKNIQSGKAPIGADQSQPIGQSQVKISSRRKSKPPEKPMDLTGLNWEAVCATAEAVARRVPAKTDQDRRAWLRYSVMAHRQFSEHWILDAAEAARSNELDGKRQAYFVAALKSKAVELDGNTTTEVFDGIAAKIEIPDRIWRLKIVPVAKGKP